MLLSLRIRLHLLVGLMLSLAPAGLGQVGTRLAPEPARFRSIGMAFDPVNDRLVTACHADDFWGSRGVLYARVGTTWQAVGATPVRLATIVTDPLRRRIVGLRRSLQNPYVLQTHLWDGANWTLAAALPLPVQVPDHPAAAFHPGTGVVVLRVGAQTYTWNGSTWTLASTATLHIAQGTMTTDPVRDRCVLLTNGTWEWDGAQWRETVPAGAVAPPNHPVRMTFDPLQRRVLAFGGFGPLGPIDTTWIYDGAEWTARSTATRPEHRHRAVVGFDPKRGRVVLHGGLGEQFGLLRLQHQTEWEWSGSDWTKVHDAPQAGLGFTLFTDPARSQPLMTQLGPAAGDARTWEWTGSGWRALANPQTQPIHSQLLSYFDSARGVTAAYAPLQREMLRWTGREWIHTPAPTGPRARFATALAYDPVRDVLVLFGGQDYGNLGDTWEWDGMAWVERFPVVSPSPRRNHVMAFDPISRRIIMTGGSPGSETWAWNGNTWSNLPQSSAPPPRSVPVLTQGPSGALILAGGYQSGSLRDVYAFDGQQWNAAGTLPAGFDQAGAVGVATDRALLIQGFESTWAWTDVPAAVHEYGSGCGSPSPRLAAAGRPTLDSPRFELVADMMRSSSVAVLVGSANAAATSVGACQLLVDQPETHGWHLAGPSGVASFSLPVPAAPFLAGLAFHWQVFALDGRGLTSSGGLATTIGH